jgi:hypothetical protein
VVRVRLSLINSIEGEHGGGDGNREFSVPKKLGFLEEYSWILFLMLIAQAKIHLVTAIIRAALYNI